jgi:hypothetical protein
MDTNSTAQTKKDADSEEGFGKDEVSMSSRNRRHGLSNKKNAE